MARNSSLSAFRTFAGCGMATNRIKRNIPMLPTEEERERLLSEAPSRREYYSDLQQIRAEMSMSFKNFGDAVNTQAIVLALILRKTGITEEEITKFKNEFSAQLEAEAKAQAAPLEERKVESALI